MSDWKHLVEPKSPVWSGVVGYCEERIGDLTRVCVDPLSTDAEIRAAQAGIKELMLFIDMPARLLATSQMSIKSDRKARAGSY